MRVRTILLVVGAVALVGSIASPSYAQGQRGRGPRMGTVKSVDTGAKTFVVTMRRMQQEQDVTIRTTAETSYHKGTDAGAFADVQAGRFAVILGEGMPAEGITAREVIVLEKQVAAMLGEVKSSDAGGKTLVITAGRPGGETRDVTIKVTDKTKYMAGRNAAKFEDLTAGKRVIVIGEGTAEAGVTAMHVRVLMPPGQ